jgi:hypothetical protein
MKINVFNAIPFSESKNLDSKILLTNCGFSPEFFNYLDENLLILQNNNIKKIKSENDIISLQKNEKYPQKKIYEAEDKDSYGCDEAQKSFYNNYNNNKCNISSYTTFPSLDCLNMNNSEIINNKKNNKYIVKAYKSKLKKKYRHLYEINSIELEKKNKFKFYHKCCYPGCNRTFSSSGWLKAHLKNHLKQIHNSKYCKLFENYVLSEKIRKMNKKNSILMSNNISSINSYPNYSSQSNINLINSPFCSELNLSKHQNIFNNENNVNLYGDNNYFGYNDFINPNYQSKFDLK